MANELIHSAPTIPTVLTQAEFEAVGLHVCNNQATGDLIYASSATQLSRLAIGSTSKLLQVSGGIPSWTSEINNITLNTAVAKGTWTASGTWTIPPVTLSGVLNANTYSITEVMGLNGRTVAIQFYIRAKSQGVVAGALTFQTTGVTPTYTDTTRLEIGGGAAITQILWSACTHSGLVLSASQKLYPVSGIAGFSVVSTALTLGTLGSIILPQGNMSGAANDAARDALSGNVAGAIAWDAADLSFWARHTDGTWKHVHLA